MLPRGATVRFLCDMRPHERAELARLTYLRAIALARARSTAASWKRLLRASKNLKAALRDRERARVGWYAGSHTRQHAPAAPRIEPRSTGAEAAPQGRDQPPTP